MQNLIDLSLIKTITPGDFAITMRQARVQFINSADEIIMQLKSDNQLKEAKHNMIGFLAGSEVK